MRFADALASSVHDIKNSLGMVLHHLDALLADEDTRIGDESHITVLRQEAQRANTNLVQLLSLYRLENKKLAACIDGYNVDGFLEELIAEHQGVLQALGIELDYKCDPDLFAYFDEGLVRSVLGSSIGNAHRYARERILLSAEQTAAGLVLRVEDDGVGFPAEMLGESDGADEIASGASDHTQLGLFFAAQVARLHVAADRVGHIELRNGCTLPGACFQIHLP